MTDATRLTKPVKILVDGREIVAEAGATLLQVALDHGIEIPHYCYHPKLSIDGSCRMCQVKVEKSPKLQIACNTPITDGMIVDTKAPEVAHAREGVMELLLVNHPLDCPICDQAGECYLQDYSVGFGRAEARTTSPRRKGLKRHAIGPRVVFDQERCILCRRCVRFTKEITGTDELRVFGMGDRSHIAASAGRPLDNPYSINTADICPVGALLSTDFHHKRRVWFLEETESVCPSCSNGCNVKLGVFRNEIQRLLPRRNDDVNDTWMCDAGRLRYRFVHDETRVREAAIRRSAPGGEAHGGNGAAPTAPTVSAAIAAAAAAIQAAIAAHGVASVAVIASGGLSNEELFRLGRLVREDIRTPHLDVAVPLGDSDDLLVKAEKTPNARGARDLAIAPGEGGRDLAGMLAACAAGEIRVLWVIGSEDLLRVAGEDAVAQAADKLDALIVQDATRSALTDRASVVIPGCVWAEKDGSFTNHAGRVQRIRKAVEPPPGLVVDGEVFAGLSGVLRGGSAEPFDHRREFEAMATAIAGYQGMTLARLGSQGAASGAGGATPVDAAPAAPAGA
jgi:NADH-quinone oxidoreductase subunit G